MHNSGRVMQSYYKRMKRVEREMGFENGPPFNILKLKITPLKTAPEPFQRTAIRRPLNQLLYDSFFVVVSEALEDVYATIRRGRSGRGS